ncbi:MAG: beta-galactosidase, partial [Lentisphaerota bacterium]
MNTIRLWSWVAGRDHTDFLNKAYNNGSDPIYVIIPCEFSGEITNAASRTLIKSRFRNQVAAYKSYPAVLMWALGNELNSETMYGGNPDAGGNLTNFFSLVNELAAEAHAEEGANAHPVTVPLADENVIETISAFNASVTNLDVWSIQPYRGGTFGLLFSQYAEASSKPLVLTEFGVDAYDNAAHQEYELFGTAQQAVYTAALWDEIAVNSAVCAGGCVMEYSDEWWKGAQGYSGMGCPDKTPCVHGDCGKVMAGHPDSFLNEEWLGIMRTVDNGSSPDIMEPREVCNSLRSRWSTGALRCDLRGLPAEGAPPLTVSFSSYLMGTNRTGVTYQWDFNNDGTIDQQGFGLSAVTHAYAAQGVYSVALRVSNSIGQSASIVKTNHIRVVNSLLTLKKEADRSSVAPGAPVTYTLTVSNSSVSVAQNVVVTENYPLSFSMQNAAPAPDSGTDNRWSLGNLNAGQVVTITIVGIAAEGCQQGGGLQNSATISAGNSVTLSQSTLTGLSAIQSQTWGFLGLRDGYFYDKSDGKPWVPHGIAYQTWNRPLGVWQTHEQIDYDLDEMVKMGANSIRVDFVWKQIEELGNNQFVWDNYDYLVQASEQRGLRIFALIGYQWPPDWFPSEWFTQHPPSFDSEGVYHDKRWPSDIINYEHPQAREQYAEWFQNVCSRYKDSKAIVGWIIGNESGYLGLWSGLQDGYDPESEAAFRQWSMTKYGTLTNLNAQLGTSYANWTNLVFINEYTPYGPDGAVWANMVQWREDSIGTFTAIGAKAAKTADTNHLISYSTVGMQWGEEDWRYHAEDRGKITRACAATNAPIDFFSVNNYPWSILGHESQNGQWGISFTKFATRSADKPEGVPVVYSETGFTSSETMWPGMNQFRQGPLVRNALWESLEAGAIGTHIFSWMDRPYITDREKGFGILTADRRIKASFWTSRDTFNLMQQVEIEKLLMGSKDPKPDIAFLWTAAVDSQYNRFECEMQQMAGAFERLGFEPNFINLEDLAAGAYTNYKVLVLPRNMRVDSVVPGFTNGVLNFLRTRVIPRGVHILASADLPGMQDQNGRPRADFTNEIAALFGIDAGDPGGQEAAARTKEYVSSFWKLITVNFNTNSGVLNGYSLRPFVWKYNDEVKAANGGVVWAAMDTGRNKGFEDSYTAVPGWLSYGQITVVS